MNSPFFIGHFWGWQTRFLSEHHTRPSNELQLLATRRDKSNSGNVTFIIILMALKAGGSCPISCLTLHSNPVIF